jgi:flagellar biosynthesis/type III secretory pathway protein FliH
MTSSSEPALWAPPDLGAGERRRTSSWPEPAAGEEGGAWCPPVLERPEEDSCGDPVQDETRQAYERGLADGLAEGAVHTRQELRPALRALGRLAEVLQAERANFARTRERNLQAIALAVAGKLVQRELAADPALVRDLLQRALDLLPLDTTLEVRLNPDDLALVEDLRDDRGGAAPARTIQWVADPALERGAFMLESPQRMVDGRLDVALRNLYDRLDHD